MRTLTFGLAAAFALGLILSAAPALADGDCLWKNNKTASTSSSVIAQGQTQQTPKPDQGG